jgi:hypothetical protein
MRLSGARDVSTRNWAASLTRSKRVTFLQTEQKLASTRLRNQIPMRELEKRGWKAGGDTIVLSKHNWSWSDDIRRSFRRVIFDVCDDWFDSEHGAHYRQVCRLADVVTCNTPEMAERIKRVTGRDAVVIDDPYEDDEQPAGMGEGVLWFGNRKGLPDLYETLDFDWPITILTDYEAPWAIPWSKERQDVELERCRTVFVPPTKMKCRSANRAVTAIRAGRFVVAGDIPSYREIPGIWVSDDYKAGLELAMTTDTTERIKEAQEYVRGRFAPERIADQWEAVLG